MSYCPVCGAVGGGGHNSFCPRNPIVMAERNHEIVCIAFEHRLKASAALTNAEIATWCHSMADSLYPPPKAEDQK